VRAERLTLWWVRRYARGLPEELRADRLGEIASDLWEHRRVSGSGPVAGLAILSRCLRGAPADLSWRRAQRRPGSKRLPSPRSVLRAACWAVALCSYLLLVAVHGVASTTLLGLGLTEGDEADVVRIARLGAVLLTMLLVGGALLRRAPGLGAVLLVGGGLGTPLVYSWAAFVFGPLGLAVGAGGIALAWRRRAS
jgi:hypothetical protein